MISWTEMSLSVPIPLEGPTQSFLCWIRGMKEQQILFNVYDSKAISIVNEDGRLLVNWWNQKPDLPSKFSHHIYPTCSAELKDPDILKGNTNLWWPVELNIQSPTQKEPHLKMSISVDSPPLFSIPGIERALYPENLIKLIQPGFQKVDSRIVRIENSPSNESTVTLTLVEDVLEDNSNTEVVEDNLKNGVIRDPEVFNALQKIYSLYSQKIPVNPFAGDTLETSRKNAPDNIHKSCLLLKVDLPPLYPDRESHLSYILYNIKTLLDSTDPDRILKCFSKLRKMFGQLEPRLRLATPPENEEIESLLGI